jgi:LmbE family N-acetylglucosaminyl deacetylase
MTGKSKQEMFFASEKRLDPLRTAANDAMMVVMGFNSRQHGTPDHANAVRAARDAMTAYREALKEERRSGLRPGGRAVLTSRSASKRRALR